MVVFFYIAVNSLSPEVDNYSGVWLFFFEQKSITNPTITPIMTHRIRIEKAMTKPSQKLSAGIEQSYSIQ